MTTRLATPDDLTRRMGITVESERALALLADASAAVISYTGQQFVRATTTAQVRVPSDRKVRLGQLPVHDVDAVTDLNNNQLLFTFDGIDTFNEMAGALEDRIPSLDELTSQLEQEATVEIGGAPEKAGTALDEQIKSGRQRVKKLLDGK